jgi:uncharacterized protein (TIGR00661 family)
VASARKVIGKIEGLLKERHYDMVVSDLEPFAPRAAKKLGVKLITIDNQHRFVFEKFRNAPAGGHALSFFLTTQVIRHYHPLGHKCIITSAFIPELDYRKIVGKVEVHAVGPIIRKEVEQLKRQAKKEDFILVYVKPQLESAIIPKIRMIHEQFVMYVKDPSAHRPQKNIDFRKHSISGFARDMSNCKAVISSAGESIMGEALFLGKPLFLLPEDGSYEQKLNGELVKLNKVGGSKDLTKVSSDDLVEFLSSLEVYERNISRMNVKNSAPEIARIIQSELP